MVEEQIFEAPLSVKTLKITFVFFLICATIVLTIIAFGIGIFVSMGRSGSSTLGGGILLLLAILFSLIPLLLKGYAPARYRVDADGIAILRRNPKLKEIRISSEKIRSLERISYKEATKDGTRVNGCGGVYGFYGEFWSSTLHNFKAYITDEDRLVVIRCQGQEPIVISPDDPDRFIEIVHQLLNIE